MRLLKRFAHGELRLTCLEAFSDVVLQSSSPCRYSISKSQPLKKSNRVKALYADISNCLLQLLQVEFLTD